MDLKLNNKRALVTGSTAGIGRAIAERLAEEGAEVIINGRKREDVARVVTEITNTYSGSKITGVSADFSRVEDIENLIRQIQDVDILINNVGVFKNVSFEEITDEEWLQMFEVNVLSGIRLARHYFPRMLTKNEGRIIFISSESGLNIPTEMIHYGMSKTAQLSVSRGLAKLTKGTNVTVNAVLPGPTWSRANKNNIRKAAEEQEKTMDEIVDHFFREVRPTSLTQRFAEPEEVANLVAYVASPLSASTNGASLRVDGGIVNSII